MGCNRSILIVYCTPVYCTLVYYMIVTSRISALTSISLREHANERYAECLGMNWCSKHLIIINNPTQNDLFTEIYNFIEVYNNLVIELAQCFGTSFFGRIDHLASSVIKFRPKNSVPKHCIRSITYNNWSVQSDCQCQGNNLYAKLNLSSWGMSEIYKHNHQVCKKPCHVICPKSHEGCNFNMSSRS